MNELKREFKREGFHNYLVIPKLKEAKEFEVQMVLNNKIEEILPVEVRAINEEEWFYYDISSKQSLNIILEQMPLSYKKVSTLVENIITGMENLTPYLLTIDNIVLDIENIYLETSNYKIYFCYVCGYQGNGKEALQKLIEIFMNKVDHREEEAVLFIYGLYQILQKTSYDIEEIKTYLKENKKKHKLNKKEEKQNSKQEEVGEIWNDIVEEDRKEKEIKKISIPVKLIEKDKKITEIICVIFLLWCSYFSYRFYCHTLEKGQVYLLVIGVFAFIISIGYFIFLTKREQKLAVSNISGDWKEEVLFEEEEKSNLMQESMEQEIQEEQETMLLIEEERKIVYPKLISKKREEIIELVKFPFVIGSLKDSNNYCIKSKTVSKIHAKILKEGEEYYIIDLNSKNGTYVNQEAVFPNALVLLKEEDEVKFADETYTFSEKL